MSWPASQSVQNDYAALYAQEDAPSPSAARAPTRTRTCCSCSNTPINYRDVMIQALFAAGLILVAVLVVVAVVAIRNQHADRSFKYLSTGFTNVPLEDRSYIPSLPIEGELPTWLNGSFIRNGPAWYLSQSAHWFDGLARLYAFRIRNGQVSYRSRFVESWWYNATVCASAVSNSTVNCTEVSRSASGAADSLNSPFSIRLVAGHYLTNTDSLVSNEFDPVTLETLASPFKFVDPLTNNHPAPAHGHYDSNGTFVHVLQDSPPLQTPYYNLYKVYNLPLSIRFLTPGKVYPLVNVTGASESSLSYQHSFSITKHFVVLIEAPLKTSNKGYSHWSWLPDSNPTATTMFRVLHQGNGSELAWFKAAEPFMTYHHVNAWEDPRSRTLNVDVIQYPDLRFVQNAYLSTFLDPSLKNVTQNALKGVLMRYTLDLTKPGSTVTGSLLTSQPLEFPAIHYHGYNGRAYRYVYGLSLYDQDKSTFYDALVKVDTWSSQSDKNFLQWHAPDCYPSEPVFVARPGAVDEDDGVLLSVVLNGKEKQSFLLVLNGHSMAEMARVVVPATAIPLGLHGHFYPGV